jgi:hypothetical protein
MKFNLLAGWSPSVERQADAIRYCYLLAVLRSCASLGVRAAAARPKKKAPRFRGGFANSNFGSPYLQ